MEDNFEPNSVQIGIPPLLGTMACSELEAAAALLVATCARKGAFGPVEPREVQEMLEDCLNAKCEPWYSLNRNPFFNPDFHALANSIFARWVSEPGGPIEFTQDGLDALRKYVRVTT